MSGILTAAVHLNAVRKKQFYPQEKLREHQFKCLKKTLRFAMEKIPYYLEAYASIKFDAIRNWDDFEQIPVLTKQDIRARPPEYFLPIGIDRKKIWKSETTGSSGIPIAVFRNADSTAWDRALIHYCYNILGIRIYHRFCQILAVVSQKPRPAGPLARLGIKRNFVVELRQTDAAITRDLLNLKPDAICTYPSVFMRLAGHLKAKGIRLHKVRWLVAQGEVLPEIWRSAIEDAFQAPLYHTYGTTEFARVGFECREKRGYHLIADSAVVEVLKDGKPAALHEEGEMIVTNLNNFCSPLIRYQIGDRAIVSQRKCPCGITYPLLESITGRLDDYLILPSGRRVSARALTHMQFDGITQYKVIQISPSHLKILIVPTQDFGAGTVRQVRKILSGAFLGEHVDVDIEPTEKLPVSRTGKLQLVSREF